MATSELIDEILGASHVEREPVLEYVTFEKFAEWVGKIDPRLWVQEVRGSFFVERVEVCFTIGESKVLVAKYGMIHHGSSPFKPLGYRLPEEAEIIGRLGAMLGRSVSDFDPVTVPNSDPKAFTAIRVPGGDWSSSRWFTEEYGP